MDVKFVITDFESTNQDVPQDKTEEARHISFRLINKYRFKPNGLQHYVKTLRIFKRDSNVIFLITGKSNKIPVRDKSDCIVKMEKYTQEIGCRALKKYPNTSIVNKTQELIKDFTWSDYRDICCPLCCLFHSRPFVALEVVLTKHIT